MPIFEFRCSECGEMSEQLFKHVHLAFARCPKCPGRPVMVLQPSGANFAVKGFNAKNGYSGKKGQ